jgi:hypothetical protein
MMGQALAPRPARAAGGRSGIEPGVKL